VLALSAALLVLQMHSRHLHRCMAVLSHVVFLVLVLHAPARQLCMMDPTYTTLQALFKFLTYFRFRPECVIFAFAFVMFCPDTISKLLFSCLQFCWVWVSFVLKCAVVYLFFRCQKELRRTCTYTYHFYFSRYTVFCEFSPVLCTYQVDN